MGTTLTITPPERQSSGGSAPHSAPQRPWIYGPWTDFTIGCGAWSAPLLLAGAYVAKSQNHAWSFAFYFLALLFNYPHFMATVYRAYHTQSEFAKYRVFTLHVALLLAAAGAIAHLWYPLLPWIFSLYIFWSPWHYTGQNFGLLMIFARRAGLAPTPSERRALHLSFIASYILLLLSFQTGASGDPLILSLGLPARFTLPARVVLALFFFGASGWAFQSLARRSSLRAIAAPLTLGVTQFLWFLLPAVIELASGREVPQTRYSSGILAVLHSAQYLWITSYYQSREARAAGDTRWRFSTYFVTLLAGGIALFIPGPWIASRVFHADFAASFLTFTALVNIHHFLLDGALWKLRDSRIASLLLNTQKESRKTLAAAPNAFAQSARWLAGPSSGARTVRIAAALVLFLWAAVDQLHFFWSNEDTSLAALQRAANLNPDDSAIQIRLARAQAVAGRPDAAVAALQHAAALNSQNLAIQESLARILIETHRSNDAYFQYQKLLAKWPRDVEALVNYGLLALRLGHEGEAVDSWQRAIAVDPRQSNAQLYLAQALDQRGELQAAARHYRSYLQIIAAKPVEHRNEGSSVIVALVKVADADSFANHYADAVQGYKAGISFAEKSGDKTIESLALIHFAAGLEKQGDAAGAAQSYQHALALDASLSDPRSAASDWFNYGQFLLRRGNLERYALACFLNAEDLLRATPGEELSAIVQARSTIEEHLAGAASLHRDFAKLAAEAASLPQDKFTPAASK